MLEFFICIFILFLFFLIAPILFTLGFKISDYLSSEFDDFIYSYKFSQRYVVDIPEFMKKKGEK